MTKTIIMEHIPRTIFAVKYNMKISKDITIINKVNMCNTKNEQDKLLITLNKQPKTYSEIKPIKWLIKV